MNKTAKRLFSAALAGALTMTAAGAADSVGSLSPQGAQAYLDTLQTATDICGSARVGADGMWDGISLARLIDFDGDGVPELYYAGAAADGPVFQRLFTYADGAAVQLDIPDAVSNFGTDLSPSTQLFTGEGRAYLVDGHEIMNGGTVTYYTKQGSDMAAALTYTDADGQYPDGTSGRHVCTLNGESVSYEELQDALAAFTAGMARQDYSFWQLSDVADSPAGTVAETIAALRTLTAPTAQVSSHKVQVDGEAAAPAAYVIGGSNYVKLRDVAQLLNGTAAQFGVEWDGAARRIDLTDGAAYEPVGGELAAPAAGGKQAALTEAPVYLDGQALDLTAYEIDGNNYFKLRDLGAALDFGVTWDAQTRTVRIDTDAPYTEE